MLGRLKAGFGAVFVVMLFALVGCGGGGGGGGGAYSVSPTSITFTATQNATVPAPQYATVTVNRGTIYFAIVTSGTGFTASFSVTGSATGKITVNPVAPTMAPGTYTGQILVYGCSDEWCSDEVDGSPKTINVSYTIQPRTGLKVNPISLTFSQIANGPAPSAQSFTLSDYVADSSYAWNAAITYQSGSDWLRIDGANQATGDVLPATPTISINPLTTVGIYTAVIHITGNNSSVDIPVTYAVSEPQLTAAPTSLAFGVYYGVAVPATQSVALTTEADLPISFSAAVNYGAGATNWLTAPAEGTAPGSIDVGVNTTTLAPGTYTATLVIRTPNQSQSIAVTYTVSEPQLTAAPTTLTFSANSYGAAPGAQSVVLSTELNVPVSYSINVNYGAEAADWLTVPAEGTAPASIDVGVNTTQLAPGTYTATLVLTTVSQSRNISVTFQVLSPSLTLAPATLNYSIGNSSITAVLTQSVAVGDTGGSALPWTASTTAPWLSIGTPNGTTLGNGTTQSVSLTLVTSELEKLDIGPYAANVTFSYTRPDTTVGTLQLPVTLNMSVSRVNFVAPYVAIANTENSLIIRGQGFTGLTSNDVRIGESQPSALNVVSDTEIRVTLGALAAQTYPVTVLNQLGLNRSRANLVVIDPQTYNAVSFDSTGTKTRVIFDDERRAFYVVNTGTGAVERYVYDPLAFSWAPDSVSVLQVRDAALSPDGTRLLAISDYAFQLIDPSDLSVQQTTVFSVSNSYLRQVAFANNGKAILATGCPSCSGYTYVYKYDMLTNGPLVTVAAYPDGQAYKAAIGGCADGTRIWIGDSGVSPLTTVRYYDATTDTQVKPDRAYLDLQWVALNRNGTRGLVKHKPSGSPSATYFATDANLLLQASLPSTTSAAAISPDGAYAYTYDSGNIRKFDLNGVPVAGYFPEVGPGTPVVGEPIMSSSSVLGISADGNTLVVAGDLKVVIMPAP